MTGDLTKYHPSLTAGTEGYAIGPWGQWSRSFDRFTGVRFPQVTLDVLWSSLQIIDEAYLREKEQERQTALREAAQAEDVVQYVSPRGAVRYLSFHVPQPDGSRRERREFVPERAEELCRVFAAAGITLRTESAEQGVARPLPEPPRAPAPPEPPRPLDMPVDRFPHAARLPDGYPVPQPRGKRRPTTLARLCTVQAWTEYLLDRWAHDPPTDPAVVEDTIGALDDALPHIPEAWDHPNLWTLNHLWQEELIGLDEVLIATGELRQSVMQVRAAIEAGQTPSQDGSFRGTFSSRSPLPAMEASPMQLVVDLCVDGRPRKSTTAQHLIVRVGQPGERAFELRVDVQDAGVQFTWGRDGEPPNEQNEPPAPTQRTYDFHLPLSGRPRLKPLLAYLQERGWTLAEDRRALRHRGTVRAVLGPLEELDSPTQKALGDDTYALRRYFETRLMVSADADHLYSLDALRALEGWQTWQRLLHGV